MTMRLRLLVPILSLSSLSLIAVACGSGGSSTDGDGGAGPGAGGASPSAGGAAGASPTPTPEGGAGGACSSDGTGTVVIEVTGLPDGVAPDVTLSGAHDYNLTEAGPLEGAEAGTYTVTAARVFDTDPLVRTVFDATVKAPSFCLADGGSHTVKLEYAAIPSSNKLWMTSDMDAELAGYYSSAITETGITDASVAIDGPGSTSIAFDRDGNLWAVGPTVGDDLIARFKATDLGESGTRTPDVHFNVPEIDCSPAVRNIAFDADGNLWLSGCAGIRRIPSANLTGTSDKVADVVLDGLTDNDGLAFDRDGNLWVGGGAKLLRFDAARLGSSDSAPADLSLTITAALGNKGISADVMAFDKGGNLWGIDEGGNFVFQLAATALAQTGDKAVKAEHSFVVDVQALPLNPAFDDENNLWVSLVSGTFGGFSPTQLGASKDTGAPVTPAILITSESIGAGLPIAFFPAPEGLPLFHSLPQP